MLRGLDKNLKTIYGIWISIVVSSIILLPLIFASPALTDGLTAYYSFDESSGTNLPDVHTKLHNGTLVYMEDADWVSGKIGNALSFDAINEQVRISDYIYGTTTFSFNGWINISTTDGSAFIWTHQTPATYNGFQVGLGWITTSYYAVCRYGKGSAAWQIVSTTGPLTRTWHMITCTKSATNLSIWIDGAYNNSISSSYNIADSTALIYIGASQGTGTKAMVTDEFGVYNITLNATQISKLWNNGNGLAYPFVPVDTCTCAGAGNNWEIAMSDYCNITTACDLTTGTLSFTGAGWTNCNASVDTTNLGDPGASGILYIQDSCLITID